MISQQRFKSERERVRRELLQQYLRLQRDLLEGNPASSEYQTTIHAFRQMGYLMISSGFEEDLDRLLRIRVLDGGRSKPLPKEWRGLPKELHIVERIPV